jgi:hypothetical protein
VSKDASVGSDESLGSKIAAPGQVTSSVVSTVLVVVPDSNATIVGWWKRRLGQLELR